jgi:hypothetical protein
MILAGAPDSIRQGPHRAPDADSDIGKIVRWLTMRAAGLGKTPVELVDSIATWS